MRRVAVLPVLLAACIVTTSAFAAGETKVSATFESFASNGVGGRADLNPMPQGEVTLVHATLRGLAPDVQYIAVIYQQSGSCTTGGPTTEIVRFTPDKAGNANFVQKVQVGLSA